MKYFFALLLLPLIVNADPIITSYQHSAPRLKFHTVLPDPSGGFLWSWGGENANGVPVQSLFYVDNHKFLIGGTTIEPQLPFPLAHGDAAIVGDKGYFFGGLSESGGQIISSNAIVKIDLNTGQTSINQYMPVGVHDPDSLTVGSYVISTGGWAFDQSSSQGVMIDTLNDSAMYFPLVIPRVYHTSHEHNGDVYIVGGLYRVGGSLYNLTSVEKISQGVSESFSNLNVARRYHSSRKIGNYIYVLGGTTTNTLGRPPAIGSIERIDLVTGETQIVGSMVNARYHMQTLTYGDRYILSVGGLSNNGAFVTSSEIFDTQTNQSHTIQSPVIYSADHDRISACIGNHGYIIGGELPSSSGSKAAQLIEFNSLCTKE